MTYNPVNLFSLKCLCVVAVFGRVLSKVLATNMMQDLRSVPKHDLFQYLITCSVSIVFYDKFQINTWLSNTNCPKANNKKSQKCPECKSLILWLMTRTKQRDRVPKERKKDTPSRDPNYTSSANRVDALSLYQKGCLKLRFTDVGEHCRDNTELFQ